VLKISILEAPVDAQSIGGRMQTIVLLHDGLENKEVFSLDVLSLQILSGFLHTTLCTLSFNNKFSYGHLDLHM
jgi:hypothetical protein